MCTVCGTEISTRSLVTPDEIRAIRGIYGAGQKPFGLILGLGEGTIATYERGELPTTAHSSLIRLMANKQNFSALYAERRELIGPTQQRRIDRHLNVQELGYTVDIEALAAAETADEYGRGDTRRARHEAQAWPAPFWMQPESRRLEFKESWPGSDTIAKTAVAFANGAGGKIVFGLRSEPRSIVGVADSELFRLEERVINHIVDRCAPAIIPEVYIQHVEGKSILVVEIYPGSHKPYYLKDKGLRHGCYVRVGSVNRRASPHVVATLERESAGVAFDQEIRVDVAWDDIDLVEFSTAYQGATGRVLELAGYQKLGLARESRSDAVSTNAAVLLSGGIARRRCFPYAKIECARFKGKTPDVFLDQATIEGPVFALVEPTLAFIKRNIALGSTIGEVYRKDTWEYPLEALREAITNAVVHRDYRIVGSDIKVAIFDDMLEITSPGALPDSLAPEDLGTGRSEIRNRVLAPIFKDLGLIESWGTGIQRIRREIEDHGNCNLVLQEVGSAFQVQFVKLEVTTEVTTEVARMISLMTQEHSRDELMALMALKNAEHFRKHYLKPALEITPALVEMTIPDKPTSRNQKYRLTALGQQLKQQLQQQLSDKKTS